MRFLIAFILLVGCEPLVPLDRCTSDSDCDGDASCVGAACVECVDDDDCAVGATCANNACIPVPLTENTADILIVVDNSGSMQEEQAALVAAMFNADPLQCPIQDLANVPEEFQHPDRALTEGNGALARCGLIQLLVALGNDFHIGVITTDVGICDNRIPSAQGGEDWGFRPQRGCLQPDGAPGETSFKVIAAAQLADDNATNDDFGDRFADTIANIQTFGSPFERGLDAAATFLDRDAERAPGCADDLERFRRDDAKLMMLIITDEDDCSHSFDGAVERFGDELDGEVCGEFAEHFITISPARCYEDESLLTPVQTYVDRLRALSPDMHVALLDGSAGTAGETLAAGCIVDVNGSAATGCFASGGLSNFTQPGQPCADDTAAQRGGLPCCIADAGSRYHLFTTLMNREGATTRTDSICATFAAPLVDLAFAAAQ
jgi:hypothetical protein